MTGQCTACRVRPSRPGGRLCLLCVRPVCTVCLLPILPEERLTARAQRLGARESAPLSLRHERCPATRGRP